MVITQNDWYVKIIVCIRLILKCLSLIFTCLSHFLPKEKTETKELHQRLSLHKCLTWYLKVCPSRETRKKISDTKSVVLNFWWICFGNSFLFSYYCMRRSKFEYKSSGQTGGVNDIHQLNDWLLWNEQTYGWTTDALPNREEKTLDWDATFKLVLLPTFCPRKFHCN